MNEKQYLELCETCDSILMRSDSTVERVAISWLHIIREHPVFLEQYRDIFNTDAPSKGFLKKWLLVLRGKLRWYDQVIKAIFSDGRPWFGAEQLFGEVDVLFVSHLINQGHSGQEADFYFGEMPAKLTEYGYSVLVVLINHTDQTASDFKNKWDNCIVPRVILSKTLDLRSEIATHKKLKKEATLLHKIAKQTVSGLSKRVINRASIEALASGTHSNMRVAKQLTSLVTRFKPKLFIITHEGHAWERLVFSAARQAAYSDVKCIGYQHAVLFRLQHAIRRKLSPVYNPHHILTSGSVGKDVLESSPKLKGIPISILGSNRTYEKSKTCADTTTKSNKATCLVLPEGILSECNLLFEFSLACAKATPHLQFIWRLHPIITLKSLLAQNPVLHNLPPNILLSTESLEQDIMNSQWALYRGTTAIIPAIIAGIRPIYFHLKGEISIDPLYEMNNWRKNVLTISEFIDVINENISFFEKERIDAERYCERFFLPLDGKKIIHLM
ncbi:MAG: hypothetical protein WCL46_01855 [Chlorobium sp.]